MKKLILIFIFIILIAIGTLNIVSANNLTIEGNLSFTIYLNITEKTHKGGIAKFIEEECIPNWECTGWGEYEEGIMLRSCRDTNNCDYPYPKPIEKIETDEIMITTAEEVKEPQKQKNILPVVSIIFFIICLTLMIELLFLRRR